MTEETKIDGRTKRALDIAIARKQVSQESYYAVLRGELSLQEAKAIGRGGAPATDAPGGSSGPRTATGAPGRASAEGVPQDTPPQPVSRISKIDRSRPCLCSCGGTTKGGRFIAGHDMRMLRVAREHLTEGRELTEEQREYLDESGKMERVRARLAEEEGKRREKDVRKGKK